jgi:cytidylate kinase
MSKPYRLQALAGKIIAIDGPAGSGKSTTARLLAARLGYTYLDTGAMYRAVALLALKNNIPLEDKAAMTEIAEKISIRFQMDGDTNRVFVYDQDVTDAIRSPEVTAAVSQVSAIREVRERMVRIQREMAKKGGVVAEGRDTASVVFPEADLKIYLDASLSERARRRLLDYARLNISSTLEEQMRDLARRDSLDKNREHSPLTKTSDAVIIDTTSLTVEEQVERIVKLAKMRFMQV